VTKRESDYKTLKKFPGDVRMFSKMMKKIPAKKIARIRFNGKTTQKHSVFSNEIK